MINLNTNHLSRTRKVLVRMGLVLLFISIVLFTLVLVGIFNLDSFAMLGHSGLRTLAAISVSGCLLAAIGFYDD